jgi:hypothetical protein
MPEDSHWNRIQNPGTLLRCRRSGKLALVLTRSYKKNSAATSWPNRYLDIQWCTSGDREQELLVNVNNCFEIVSLANN